ncbi:Uncharacterized protein TCM_017489 [Theobroma cacao]|uniref:Chromo domain-containing protein n=1 Tax=Theobroma cacao TaxID=3641 RepID=A0A061EDJ9_THECC|nr:Uncharacterized protein TCM_017489 [Theobroma cacao]
MQVEAQMENPEGDHNPLEIQNLEDDDEFQIENPFRKEGATNQATRVGLEGRLLHILDLNGGGIKIEKALIWHPVTRNSEARRGEELEPVYDEHDAEIEEINVYPAQDESLVLKKGHGVPITIQCLEKFTTGGNLDDEASCDVVPMDVGHILVGRPWLYDHDMNHKTKPTTYSFYNENKRYTLYPLKKETKKSATSSPTNSKITGGKSPQYPTEIQQLLKEFRELVNEDLPKSLPPLRSIQHAIDMVPGASLPNLPAYRMPPMQRAEVQRQVEELSEKDLVSDSKSPCACPALLAPKKDGGLKPDPEKICAISEWPAPTSIKEMDLSGQSAKKALVLALPDFEKLFVVECDASHHYLAYHEFAVYSDHHHSDLDQGTRIRQFLVKWLGKLANESTWIAEKELKRVDPNIYEKYVKAHSSEPSLF